MKEALTELKAKKLKVTPQRLAIYNALLNTKEHPGAESVYAAVKQAFPFISLATIYKNLGILSDAGLLMELRTGGDSVRYDADVSPHSHAVCLKCGHVADIDYAGFIEDMRKGVAEQTGFITSHEKIYLYGECAVCAGTPADDKPVSD